MMKNRNTIRLWCLFLCAFILVNGWAWIQFADARAAALRQTSNTNECQRLINNLQGLQQQPTMAKIKAIESADLVRHIEDAVRASGLPRESLLRVIPDPAQRLGDTAYMQKPTQVQLRGVSLSQLVLFLHELTEKSGLRSTSIRISAPRENDLENKWTAELTLSYWIYSPMTGQLLRMGDL